MTTQTAESLVERLRYAACSMVPDNTFAQLLFDAALALDVQAGRQAGVEAVPKTAIDLYYGSQTAHDLFKRIVASLDASREPHGSGYHPTEGAHWIHAALAAAREDGVRAGIEMAAEAVAWRDIAKAAGAFAVQMFREKDPDWSDAEIAAAIEVFILDRLPLATPDRAPAPQGFKVVTDGPPCPTCGFRIVREERPPFVFDDDDLDASPHAPGTTEPSGEER